MAETGTSPPKNLGAEIRGVRRELANARDEDVARVLAVVDAMPRRGEADALVEPLRPRLAALRPGRPFNFARLIFAPLDPLIVPPAAWRRGTETIPRHTLAPLAAIVRRAMGPRAKQIDAALAKQTGPAVRDELAAVTRLGQLVWPEAACVLAEAEVPDGWRADTGLTDADYLQIARSVAQLLAMAMDRQRLTDQIRSDGMPQHDQFARVVAASVGAAPSVAAMATGLLLVAMPRPDLTLRAVDAHVANVGGDTGAVAERAIDFLLAHIQSAASMSSDTVSRMEALRDSALLLCALETRPSKSHGRHALIKRAREAVEASCRDSFTNTIDTHLLSPLAGLREVASEAQVVMLERAARNLRELESIGRHVGQGPYYRGLLQSSLSHVNESAMLLLADRVRLTELLAGTDAAMEVLHRATNGGARRTGPG